MKPQARKTPPLPSMLLGGSMWAIESREALENILRVSRELPLSLLGPTPPQLAATVVDQPAPQGPGIAVITLCGVLTPHGSFLSWLFGGGSGGVQGFRESLSRAVNDPEVAAIVLDVDSPGGSVGLVPEAAADVRAAREVKPVYAISNTLAASGGYYIAAQATELYCTPSGMVGSVGVYYLHEDWSKFNEEFGVDVTYIYSGKYKTEGNPNAPLSDDAKAAWQADADKLYAQFVSDVAAGRNVTADKVRSDFGEGRVLLSQDALAAGMIDGVETFESVIERALSEARTSTGASARHIGARVDHHIALPNAAADVAAGEADDEEEQARCSCGKFVIDGEEQCEACKTAAAEDPDDDDDDDDPEEPDSDPDDDDDPDEEEDEDEDNNTSPTDPKAADSDAQAGALLRIHALG